MITIKNLSFSYKRNPKLFNDFNLAITTGGVCGLLGKNSAGKTTLLKIMAGLLFPQAGTCLVQGHAPQSRAPVFLENIYLLPENVSLPNLSISQYLTFYAPFYKYFDYGLLQKNLEAFGLSPQKLLSTLSYGEQKKFLIAFGVATNTKLLLLDEPTNGLDIPSKNQFRKLLASVINENKLIIISTHQVHDIENLLDSILILDNGQNVFHHTLHEINNYLSFSYQQQAPRVEEGIYYEKRLGGYTILNTKQEDQESYIDLEVLFNAVLDNKNKLQQVFLRKVS